MIQKNTQEEYSNLTSPRNSSLPTLISEGPSEAFRTKINDEASFIIHASDQMLPSRHSFKKSFHVIMN